MPALNKAQQTVYPLRGGWGQWSDLAPASKIVIGMRTNSLELRLVIRRPHKVLKISFPKRERSKTGHSIRHDIRYDHGLYWPLKYIQHKRDCG